MNSRMSGRYGLLYQLLVTAAVSIIVFSALGVAVMTGFLPGVASVSDVRRAAPAGSPTKFTGQGSRCTDCGVIESILPVKADGRDSDPGNDDEKNMAKTARYEVRVRMQDGTFLTGYYSSTPGLAVGDSVRIVKARIAAAG